MAGVAAPIHEVGDQLHILSGSGALIMSGECQLCRAAHLHLDVDAFHGKWVVIVEFVGVLLGTRGNSPQRSLMRGG